MSKTVEDIGTLKINLLSQAQYDAEKAGGRLADDELYLTPSSGTGVSDVEVNGSSVVSGGVAEITINDIPSGGTTGQVLTKDSGTDYDVSWEDPSGGTITDVEVDGTSVVTAGVAEIDLTGKADVSHTHTKSQITDFPTIPTITDTYSSTSSNGMSGKAVNSALQTLDGTVSGTAGAGKTLTAFSQTDGKVSATFGNISITKSQVSDFPSLATVATTGDYDDLTDKPTIPSQNMWVGGCSTSINTATKIVTTSTGDFVLSAGNSVRVIFDYANQGGAYLNVDGTGAKSISDADYKWQAGEVVDFLYDGSSFVIVDGAVASLTYYGVTKLSDSVSSTSQSLSATPSAVKQAYDLASGKADAVHTHTKSDVTDFPTIPTVNDATLTIQKNGTTVNTFTANASSNVTANITVPTDTGDLTNGAGFITGVTSTSTPTASTIAEFDSAAHMNSADMTSAEVSDFVGNLGYTFNLINMFYPIGSYYETSDSTFNPNITWGGTWVLETEGQVHVSAGENYEVGDTGGEATHVLTTDEMPSHFHIQRVGGYTATDENGQGSSASGGKPTWGGSYTGKTVRTWESGGGQAHNNMQPYIVVNRWHRTA